MLIWVLTETVEESISEGIHGQNRQHESSFYSWFRLTPNIPPLTKDQ